MRKYRLCNPISNFSSLPVQLPVFWAVMYMKGAIEMNKE
jgi:hypothetical protein